MAASPRPTAGGFHTPRHALPIGDSRYRLSGFHPVCVNTGCAGAHRYRERYTHVWRRASRSACVRKGHGRRVLLRGHTGTVMLEHPARPPVSRESTIQVKPQFLSTSRHLAVLWTGYNQLAALESTAGAAAAAATFILHTRCTRKMKFKACGFLPYFVWSLKTFLKRFGFFQSG